MITDTTNNFTYIGKRTFKSEKLDANYFGSPKRKNHYYYVIRSRRDKLKKEILLQGGTSGKHPITKERLQWRRYENKEN